MSCPKASARHENACLLSPAMSDPRVQAAVLAAVITGAVAFAAIVGAIVTTWLTLRRQRNAEDQRRRHERHMRLLESGLKAAVDFLAAADRTSRARQSLDVASRTLDNAKSARSEEHTSELQSLAYLVCRLLLEKKKQ